MFRTEAELDEALSRPTEEVIATLGRHAGDIVVLGAGGKMGPTLCQMLARAVAARGETRRIYAVSRFGSPEAAARQGPGVVPVSCDLLDAGRVQQLPDAAIVFYLVGRKFGSTTDAATTWAINTYVPSLVARRYAGSRIVAFSSGNVYPLWDVESAGPDESVPPEPLGEYGMSVLGRERIFEYFSRQLYTPTVLLRLNYACDLRYGVLVDLAMQILRGEPIDLSMGFFNTIWQGDAVAMAIRALDHATVPPRVFNLTGPEVLCVWDVCIRLGERLGVRPKFVGQEADTALLSNAAAALAALGPLQVSAEQLIEWVASWLRSGGRTLDKPTHFQNRQGRF